MSGLSLSMTESQGTVRRLSAGVMGLAGFAVAMLAGLQAGNETGRVIVAALVSMVACHIAGIVLGLLIERVVEEHKRTLNAPPEQSGGAVDVEKKGSHRPPRLAA